MSYEIIFETIIVKTNDGGIIHFDRSGCNNDDYGRKQDDFIATYYDNEKAFLDYALRFKNDYENQLKINSKMVVYDKYYKYLLRKLNNAISYDDFKKFYYSSFSRLDGIEILEPIHAKYDVETGNKKIDEIFHETKKSVLVRRLFTDLKNENEIIENVKNNNPYNSKLNIFIKKNKYAMGV